MNNVLAQANCLRKHRIETSPEIWLILLDLKGGYHVYTYFPASESYEDGSYLRNDFNRAVARYNERLRQYRKLTFFELVEERVTQLEVHIAKSSVIDEDLVDNLVAGVRDLVEHVLDEKDRRKNEPSFARRLKEVIVKKLLRVEGGVVGPCEDTSARTELLYALEAEINKELEAEAN